MFPATSLNVLFDYDFKSPATEQLERVHKAGFKYIDMNFWDWCHSPSSPFNAPDWKSWVMSIKECGDKLGVVFHQAHAMVYNPFTKPENIDFLEEVTKKCIIGAGMLGIDWIVFHAAGIEGASIEETQLKNREWLLPFVELAAKNNVGIALENMNDSKTKRYCSSTEDLISLIDFFKTDNVGACWDIGHGHVQKLDQYEEIMKFGDRLKVLHVQDNNSISDQHTAPFYGTVDWKKVRKALSDVNYKGFFTFEAHTLIRAVPEDCKDAAIALLYKIGEYISNAV